MKTLAKAQVLVLSVSFLGQASSAQTMGNITPASVKMTITGIYLINIEQAIDSNTGGTNVYSGSTEVTWSASADDFSGSDFANVSIPAGRYVAARVTYSTARTVLLSGCRYRGATNTYATLANNQYICSGSGNTWTFSSTLHIHNSCRICSSWGGDLHLLP